MKRIILFCLVMFLAIGANAQYKKGQMLVCTGNNVNVRTGPGKNYPVATISNCFICEGRNRNCTACGGRPGRSKYQLMKGDGLGECENGDIAIEYLGKSKNGFHYVSCYECIEGIGTRGWVSAQYLRKK